MNYKAKAGEVSDAFWAIVEPLIPARQRLQDKTYKRKQGGWRKSLDSHRIFEVIVFVLRTGIQWKALPKERLGSPSSIDACFRKWEKAGFSLSLL